MKAVFLTLASSAILACSSSAQVLMDLQLDFSIAGQGTNGLEYGRYTTANSIVGTFSTAGWTVSGGTWYGGESLGTPAIAQNFSHPAVNSLTPAVRRYTIGSFGEPAYSGMVQISGSFFDNDSGDTSGFVTVNDINYFNMAVPNTGNASGIVNFNFFVPVLPGSTIDFGVNAGANAFSDSTGMTATVTAVPEPGTSWLLVLAGCAGLAFYRRPRVA